LAAVPALIATLEIVLGNPYQVAIAERKLEVLK
jgi:hypothetical protein